MNDMTIQYISPRIGDIYKPFVDEKRKSGFSTEKISELSGVPYNFLTRFLVGQVVNPSFEYVATLCAFFSLSLDTLAGLVQDGAEAATGSLENVLESKIHALELDNAKLAGENIRLESFNQQLLQIVGGTRK